MFATKPCPCKCNHTTIITEQKQQYTGETKSGRAIYKPYTVTYEYCKECGHKWKIAGGTACFIATAAYGTPFAYEINVLREWRDESLLKNPLGHVFVNFYYHISPPIAKLIEKSEFSKKLVRAFLTPFVRYLKKRRESVNKNNKER